MTDLSLQCKSFVIPVGTGSHMYCAFCRMGLLDVFLFGGLAAGGSLSAPLFSVGGKYGYVTVFATSATCYLLSFLYVTFIPESVNVSQVREQDTNSYPVHKGTGSPLQWILRATRWCCVHFSVISARSNCVPAVYSEVTAVKCICL